MKHDEEEVKETSTWLIMVLVIAVLGSGIAVIYAKHINRKLFIELQALQNERDDMNMEWGRLQLEQSTFSTHSNVDRIAREKLDMELPAQEEIVIVRP